MTLRERAIEAMQNAMRNAVIRDDEGEFPRLFDLLDFSGENKARTVVCGLATAALYAALEVLSNPGPATLQAGADNLFGSSKDDWREEAGDIFRAMLATVGERGDG